MGDWLPDADGRFLGETLTPRRWDGGKLINIPPVPSFKFGAEGASTTSLTYVTIANSDIALNPALFKKGPTLYVKFIYHMKNDTAGQTTYMRVLRQNVGTPVVGSEASMSGAGWGIVETAWIDWSAEATAESYQLQLRVTAGVGEFNSALMVLSPVQL